MSNVVVGLPIGSNCAFGFVFKDYLGMPIVLDGSEFFIRLAVKYPTLALEFGTVATPDKLYVEENATIQPVGGTAYVADRLVLLLTPVITRQVPLGALTHWEIERRKDGEQSNWGAGIFSGHGGINPDA